MDTRCKIGFGGGCHWCTEAVFQLLKGVTHVAQGFIAAREPDSSYSEAVIVSYNQDELSLKELITVHLHTHNSTADHSLRTKYRSAIYVFDEGEINVVKKTLKSLQCNFKDPLITQVLLFGDFKPSETQFHNYYYSNPDKPFCKTYIDPKLDKLSANFSALLKGNHQ
ncbi:peptide-methionine (S)-S-oxide reductase [Sediminicola sp. 1XM1-17]|uniref:peptide-methionine (S)-S-oxide reductase n=1 Tax=Sediminicola sp. 1XM1-17 TaxID=3127702 RepID=UPI003077F941